MFEWTIARCFKMINLYRERPELWNPHNPMYSSRHLQLKAWATISKNLGVPIGECKFKMRSILGSLRREKCRMRKAQANNSFYSSKWVFFDKLNFLSKENNAAADKPDENQTETTAATAEESESVHETEMEENDTTVTIKTEIKEETPELMETPDLMNNFEFENAAQNEEISEEEVEGNVRKEKKEEVCELFGQYVASKMRGYSDRTRVVVEHLISNILFEASMGKYDNGGENNGEAT